MRTGSGGLHRHWLIAGVMAALSACASKPTDGPLYIGMSFQHFQRVACLDEPQLVSTVERVRVYDCQRATGQVTVELFGGEVYSVHGKETAK